MLSSEGKSSQTLVISSFRVAFIDANGSPDQGSDTSSKLLTENKNEHWFNGSFVRILLKKTAIRWPEGHDRQGELLWQFHGRNILQVHQGRTDPEKPLKDRDVTGTGSVDLMYPIQAANQPQKPEPIHFTSEYFGKDCTAHNNIVVSMLWNI